MPKASEVHPELRARRDLRVEPRAESGAAARGKSFGARERQPARALSPSQAPWVGVWGCPHTDLQAWT